MAYPWIKAFHLAAVIAFVGGLLVLCLVRAGWPATAASPASSHEGGVLSWVLRWDRAVTAPALAIVWLLGGWMLYEGGWWVAPWMWLKLLLVTALSGLHGAQAGALRRLAHGDTAASRTPGLRFSAHFAVGASALVAVLVVVKPF